MKKIKKKHCEECGGLRRTSALRRFKNKRVCFPCWRRHYKDIGGCKIRKEKLIE